MNIKKDQRAPTRWKHFLLLCFRKLLFVAIFLSAAGAAGYLLYTYVPAFQESIDDFLGFARPLYEKLGFWKFSGLVVLLLAVVWALMEEQRMKQQQKQS